MSCSLAGGIFNSWCETFSVSYDKHEGAFAVTSSGQPFNDAYRYVDWLLTVPLLLIELILVMQLSAEETSSKSWTLGLSSALMVALGYPGEVQDDPEGRWLWWAMAMVPFFYVVYELVVGLSAATQTNSPSVASLISSARYLTAFSWLTYPFVSALCGRQAGQCSRVAAALAAGLAVAARRPGCAAVLGRGSWVAGAGT